MTSITENLAQIRERLRTLEQQYERSSGSVRLMVVSKAHPVDRIHEALQAGARDFGENYVKEALDKIHTLSQTHMSSDICWHFIGPLQSNKTRDVAEHFHWVHSVDRLKIARRLNDQRPEKLPPLEVCVQVNISNESSKSGITLADAPALCQGILSLPRLRLRGLMAIPAPCDDLAQQRCVYRPLATLFRELATQHETMDTLSIGMSDDLEAAVAEGSTMVRIGTAIFGPRLRQGED